MSNRRAGAKGSTESLRARALTVCAAQPGSVLTYPFGPDVAVFKVGGKVFALLDLVGEPARLTLKAEPEAGAALVRDQAWAAPGYHMNKRHWITLTLVEPLAAERLRELVEDSYDLVVDGLPRDRRPPSAPAP